MGRILAFLAFFLILALIIGAIAMWFRRSSHRQEDKRAGRPARGDLNAQQEQMLIRDLDQAAEILRRIATPPSALDGEFTLLSDTHRVEVERWLHAHEARKALNPR